ncbi:hypothetical protein [Mycolicibacterium grossiae]|uniref:Uncharacterized protein n=1 Tax=Mycolicibacterium grossiae TaxID=1552759 RepID=A0A1E8PYN1_9MYCO|nr:hypothetical protein [Mycolicibacterium grossiae]OFJ51217.1 hypothetical protein BEL07_23915 [Mycolicibacterium grossiae]QEM46826.1 hypothetical protein FZ046_20450 [Mycolicibacterium grossiae]
MAPREDDPLIEANAADVAEQARDTADHDDAVTPGADGIALETDPADYQEQLQSIVDDGVDEYRD